MRLLPKNIGILSFLGPFKKHQEIFESLGVMSSFVKSLEDLESVDALVIPGTEIASLHFSLKELLPYVSKRQKEGMPLFLTGEALVLLAEAELTDISFKKMDIQKFHIDSPRRFNEDIRLSFSDTRDFSAPYVRPPKIQRVSKGFHVLASKRHDASEPVCIEKDNILACSFYPEFSGDKRIHEYFLTKI
ncbi:hypothetical protein HON22_03600 [Candidatus Peregrinibacteria bacterium]|nr:hypothetical protein [Candidatus Peregrinibacteria bacterium]